LTKPTITFGHNFLDDCNSTTGWSLTDVGLAAAVTVENGDVFRITGTCGDGGDEYAYYAKDVTNFLVLASTKLLVRWRTSVAANGLQARVRVTYTAGAPTDTALGFSTAWTVTTISLAAEVGRTIDTVLLFADDNPDAIAAGTFTVDFDFVLICQGVFAFPFVSGGIDLEGFNNNQYLKIPGKVGNATQYLGGDDSTIRVWGDIDTTGVDAAGVPIPGAGWHGIWTTHDGEVFYQILDSGFSEPWNWFTSDVCSLKVTLDRMRISQARSNENLLSYELDMHEYRLGSASAETNLERFGIT
jgi:hypothetical protein